MRVMCAWCQSEGRPSFVREKAPLADVRETHSICPFHLHRMSVRRDPLVPRADEPSLLRHESVLAPRLFPRPIGCLE